MTPTVFLAGLVIGIVLAAPVGPLALICIHRSVDRGSLHGFVSGLGIATADAVYAGIAASGLALAGGFLVGYLLPLRVIAGLALIAIGYRVYITAAGELPSLRNGDASYIGEYSTMTALTFANVVTVITVGILLAGSGVMTGADPPVTGIVFAGGVFFGEASWWLLVCYGLGRVNCRISPARRGMINRITGGVVTLAGIVMLLSAAVA